MLETLEKVGIAFEDEGARNVLSQHGVRIEGNQIYFTESIVEQALSLLPHDEETDAQAKKAT